LEEEDPTITCKSSELNAEHWVVARNIILRQPELLQISVGKHTSPSWGVMVVMSSNELVGNELM
jgi:hypothetical protein